MLPWDFQKVKGQTKGEALCSILKQYQFLLGAQVTKSYEVLS